ncbi:MAG: UDP-N-acetylglucosamine 2-epimerase (non-hydrolyzing) [Acidimicrobiia bacterium]|nr:UDP-N-acetylglucosamine 2-epimerase (non-hydrolyzing) [Acidimicrobiia bacterium]MDH4307719.1 UDP-N-acetylglucosamine 2-epimerase (non-hydrolyzing) [Acidimicrobiia bacterium]
MTHIHVVGARPNFMKAAPVIKALVELGEVPTLIHTGQHYDALMSDVFFRDLGIPAPDVHLGVGSGSHAQQTAALLTELERVFREHQPEGVVVYGDVNSTLAAALASSKLGIPTAHVEAGLRSFDRSMPEEINRVVTDALADLHLVTSPEALALLSREGISADRMHFVGNTMIDSLIANRHLFDDGVATALGISEPYGVITLHRPGNVDDRRALRTIVSALAEVSRFVPLVFPVHPRGKAGLEAVGLESSERLRLVEPLGYIDFMSLVSGAALVITDSGGIQEETTVLGIPCLTMRPNTERPITITQGTNRLVRPDELGGAVEAILKSPPDLRPPPPLWDGHAGGRAASVIADWLRALRDQR